MEQKIKALLKEKIGTSWKENIHENGLKYIELSGYGRKILIIAEIDTNSKIGKITKIIYPSKDLFSIEIACNHPNYEALFVSSVKTMVDLIKKSEVK